MILWAQCKNQTGKLLQGTSNNETAEAETEKNKLDSIIEENLDQKQEKWQSWQVWKSVSVSFYKKLLLVVTASAR